MHSSRALQGKRDLIPQPSVLETDALPVELLPFGGRHHDFAAPRAHENNGDSATKRSSVLSFLTESNRTAPAEVLDLTPLRAPHRCWHGTPMTSILRVNCTTTASAAVSRSRSARVDAARAVISDLVAGVLAGLAVAMPIGAIGTYLVGLAAASGLRLPPGPHSASHRWTGRKRSSPRSVGLACRRSCSGSLRADLAGGAVLVLVGDPDVAAGDPPLPPRPLPSDFGPSRLARARLRDADRHDRGQPGHGDHLRRRGAWPQRRGRLVRRGHRRALRRSAPSRASATWQLLLAGGGSLLGRLLTGRRGQLGIPICSAAHHARPRRRGAAALSPPRRHRRAGPSRRAVARSRPAARRWRAPRSAAATSAGDGKLGAIRMLRSRGSSP